MVVTEKRHMYPAGTVNVETGNVVVKQDINYYGTGNVQSAMKSIIRFIEDSDKRFSQNQIYDGCTVSNGTTTVDVASGTLKIGGRWVSLSGTNISAAVGDGFYNVIAEVTGVTETSTRDPSGGEAVTLSLELSGSWSASDYKLVLGGAEISSSNVDAVQDMGKRHVNATIIKPYGASSQVSIYSGNSPVYREAIRFTTNEIFPYNKIVSEFPISGTAISGTTLDISGQSNFGSVSGSAHSAVSYTIGSKTLEQSEFDNLDGQDQGVRIADSPTFVQLTASQTGTTIAPFLITSTFLVSNLNADLLDGQHAPNGVLVGTTDLQTLTNKTLTTPTIASFISGTHDHSNDAGGAIFDFNNLSGTLIVDNGGTGFATATDGGIILGNAGNTLEVTSRPADGQILVGHTTGSPTVITPSILLTGSLSGSVNLSGSGVFNLSGAVLDDSHAHDTQYYTKDESDQAWGINGQSIIQTWGRYMYGTDPASVIVEPGGFGILEIGNTGAQELIFDITPVQFINATTPPKFSTYRIQQIFMDLDDANGTNYVDKVYVTSDSNTNEFVDLTNESGSFRTYTVDTVMPNEQISFRVFVSIATANTLQIRGIRVRGNWE